MRLRDFVHAHEHGAEIVIHRRTGGDVLHIVGHAGCRPGRSGAASRQCPSPRSGSPVEAHQMDDLGEIGPGGAVDVVRHARHG